MLNACNSYYSYVVKRFDTFMRGSFLIITTTELLKSFQISHTGWPKNEANMFDCRYLHSARTNMYDFWQNNAPLFWTYLLTLYWSNTTVAPHSYRVNNPAFRLWNRARPLHSIALIKTTAPISIIISVNFTFIQWTEWCHLLKDNTSFFPR